MAEEKIFKTTLILDWKSGKFKAMTRPPRNFKANEIPIDFSLKVKLPEPIRVKAHGEITLSESKISDIVAEAL